MRWVGAVLLRVDTMLTLVCCLLGSIYALMFFKLVVSPLTTAIYDVMRMCQLVVRGRVVNGNAYRKKQRCCDAFFLQSH